MTKTFYVKVSNKEIEKTKPLGYGVYVDLDSKGKAVGIEIIMSDIKK
jgi:uncharacterized protein YuzE